jgi:uncharacterized protein YndB with AHSA1/START domain
MPNFTLQEREADWAATAPVVLTRSFPVAAPPDQVFGVLADIAHWSDWCAGMRKVRLEDGPTSGVGAVRTVWVGTTRVQERFLVWEPGARLSFVLTSINTPGLKAMVEDYRVAADGEGGTTVTATIGIEGGRVFRHVPGLIRAIVGSSTKGITGLATKFA